VYGDARYTCPSLWPMRPGKFLRAGHMQEIRRPDLVTRPGCQALVVCRGTAVIYTTAIHTDTTPAAAPTEGKPVITPPHTG